MKKRLSTFTQSLFLVVLSITILFSCRQTRYITEQYIKTEIEDHKTNTYSQIRTYSIFKGVTTSRQQYVEFTGYKYNNQKGLVIGADRVYALRERFPNEQAKMIVVDYIELTVDECKQIIENYDKLVAQLTSEKPKMHEEIYADFTVNQNLFISLRKAGEPNELLYIHLWINKEKYSLSTYTLMRKLKEFLKY
jgi:hypothetical protein